MDYQSLWAYLAIFLTISPNVVASQSDPATRLVCQEFDGQVAGSKRARKGGCLLSLDGGGIRVLSQIAILHEISNRIKHDLGIDETPRLCNYFDMIGGVGTGGLLAILIGRLGLTVQQAEQEYLSIMGYISSASVDHTAYDHMLKAIIKKYIGDSETLMYDPHSSTNHCKVFVGATAAVNTSRLTKFRSYEARWGQERNLPIWQVARVSLAHPGQSFSIQIGPKPVVATYVSGEFGWNNPSKEVIREFEAEQNLAGILCFISIGTGQQQVMQIDSSNDPNILNSAAKRMVTDCQRVSEEIAHQFQGQSNYFRLSVEQGLQRSDGLNALRPEDVIVHTKAYLDLTRTNISIDRLVNSLLPTDKVFPWQTTRERFERTMETFLRNTRSCVGSIKIDAIKIEALAAVSILESIRQANSDEEEWLELATAVDNYTGLIACDIIPRIWEPSLEDPLWSTTNNYFVQLQEVYTDAMVLIERRSEKIWERNTKKSLPSKWAASLKKSFKGIQMALASGMYNQVALLRKQKQEKEREQLLLWLSTLQPECRHEGVRAKRSEGTGMWFLNAPIFLKWCISEGIEEFRVLLSCGAPGAGKTTLFSTVIDYLRKASIRTNAAVLFLYCDYRDQLNQNFVNMVGSLAKQLGLQAPSIPTAIWEPYKRAVNAQQPINVDILRTMINTFVKLFDCVYICVDGLDECHSDARKQLLELFKTITGTTLRLFVTGRPNVEAELNTCMADKSVSEMPIVAKREDLQIYLSERFSQDPYPEAMDLTLQAQITDRIIQWSQGIFLLSKLQIAAVLEHDTKRDRREALSRIPVGLSETYTITLERIKQQPQARSERAILILTWIYYAERSLRVKELQYALAVKANDIAFDMDGMPSETALVDCCLGLVVIERETATICLTHFTLQEYFNNHQSALLPSGHTMIAKTCLTYLSFDHTSDLEEIEESSPFINYVGFKVGHHLRKGGDMITNEMALDLLDNRDKFSILKIFVDDVALSFHRYVSSLLGTDEFRPGFSPLHWVALFGVHSIASATLQTADDPNAKEDYQEATPLSLAAEHGHDVVVQLLVNTPGVKLNPRDQLRRTPLYVAAENGRYAVVKLLINTPGVDLNSKDRDDQTPLFRAAASGHDTTTQLLLNTPGVELNPKDRSNRTPVHIAAEKGHFAVVKLLVNTPGVQADSKDYFNRTPLFWAASKGHAPIVRLLINYPGVELNPRDYVGQTPLCMAANNGHYTVVKLLANLRGVDLNPRDKFQRTPLALAAAIGHVAVVKLLVDTPGVDLNPRDDDQQTPLSQAAANGHNAIVDLLISTPGVDLNPMDKRTSLSLAAGNGHDIEMLTSLSALSE